MRTIESVRASDKVQITLTYDDDAVLSIHDTSRSFVPVPSDKVSVETSINIQYDTVIGKIYELHLDPNTMYIVIVDGDRALVHFSCMTISDTHAPLAPLYSMFVDVCHDQTYCELSNNEVKIFEKISIAETITVRKGAFSVSPDVTYKSGLKEVQVYIPEEHAEVFENKFCRLKEDVTTREFTIVTEDDCFPRISNGS